MKIIFTGVGEAFDENIPNTSLLVVGNNGKAEKQILLDCGFTAAHAFWCISNHPLNLDSIWVSHFHGDHFFGIPLILLRFIENGRIKPLHIIGQEGIKEKVISAMDLAYPGFPGRIKFPIDFREVSLGKDLSLDGCQWSFAKGLHSQPCLAVRLDCRGESVFYSGDGRPTEATVALATGADLIVHEAFGIDSTHEGHGSVHGSIDFARAAGAKKLALVHVNRDVRYIKQGYIKKTLGTLDDMTAFLPEPGDETIVSRKVI